MEAILEELYELVKKKASEQGAYTQDAYKEVIRESIQYFLERGKITDDDNIEFMEARLLKLLPQLKEEMSY